MHQLLRRFSVFSFVAIGLAASLLIYLNHKQAMEQILAHANKANQIYAQTLRNAVWTQLNDYLQFAARSDDDTLRDHPKSHRLQSQVSFFTLNALVQKVKVLDLEGRTVFSTELEEIGNVDHLSKGFKEIIFSGQPVSVANFSNHASHMIGTSSERDIVETYVPIHGENNELVAVFEVYTDVSEQHHNAMQGHLQQMLALLLIFALLYVVLVLVVQRADKAVQRERALLTQRVEERTAELLEANEQLAQAARSKDEFLTSMSHELRTPLNAVLGLSEALQEQVFGTLNEQQLKSLKVVEQSARHLLALINDILDVARIGAEELQLQLEAVDVEQLCRASVAMIETTASKKRLQLSTSICPSVSVVRADQRRLKQILVNLLSNAVKFTPANGKVALEVTAERDAGLIKFSVSDSGIGISEDNLKRLFKPFVQIDSRLAREYEGTGLGLALVYGMTQRHGGSVSVVSTPGEGSCFTVTMPAAEAETNAPLSDEPAANNTADAPAMSPAGPLREDSPLILLAEDNEVNVHSISAYLRAKGYRVLVAGDGSEAIQQARLHRPAAILMDVQMPGMDGLEATRRLRSEPQLAQIPIIVLTALAMPGDRERCLASGADEYLSKPVRLKQMIEVIEKQLHSERDELEQAAANA